MTRIGETLGNARAATVAYVVLRFDSSAARAKSPAVGRVGFATDEASLIRCTAGGGATFNGGSYGFG